MSALEIAVLVVLGLFVIGLLLKLFDFKFADLFKSKPKEPKEKKTKKKKEKKTKQENTKTQEKQTEEKKEPEKKEKAFEITKKGVAKINKKAIKRDSRSGAVIEQAIVREKKKPEETDKKLGFEDFDDLLNKLKDIGDPDELDDDTFRELFLSNGGKELLDGIDISDDELSSNFVSLESGENEKIDRTLKHYTIDGNHLRLGESYEGLPIRRPMIDMDRIKFTERITGKYDNIRTGDVSNVLKIETPVMEEPQAEEIDSDEEIFAKIMERRRRELGISEPNRKNEDKNENGFSVRDIVISDAIMNPKFKKNNK